MSGERWILLDYNAMSPADPAGRGGIPYRVLDPDDPLIQARQDRPTSLLARELRRRATELRDVDDGRSVEHDPWVDDSEFGD